MMSNVNSWDLIPGFTRWWKAPKSYFSMADRNLLLSTLTASTMVNHQQTHHHLGNIFNFFVQPPKSQINLTIMAFQIAFLPKVIIFATNIAHLENKQTPSYHLDKYLFFLEKDKHVYRERKSHWLDLFSSVVRATGGMTNTTWHPRDTHVTPRKNGLISTPLKTHFRVSTENWWTCWKMLKKKLHFYWRSFASILTSFSSASSVSFSSVLPNTRQSSATKWAPILVINGVVIQYIEVQDT